MYDREASNRKRRLLIIGRSRTHPIDETPADTEHKSAVLSVNDRRFRVACGLEDSIEVAICKHRGKTRDSNFVTIDRPSILIGRGKNCDICLPNRDVSFRHAYIQLIEGQIYCYDLASRAGTYCNSDRRCSGPLSPGGEISVGPYKLQVTPEEREEAATDNGTAAPAVAIQFLNSSPSPEPLALDRAVTLIGMSRRCRVRLSHESVSGIHCSVIRTKAGIWVVDLLGRGGTFVNGQAVDVAPLNDGDELTVGRFQMQIRPMQSYRPVALRKTELSRRPQQLPTNRLAGTAHTDLPSEVEVEIEEVRVEVEAVPISESTLIPRPSASLIPGSSSLTGSDLTRQTSGIATNQSGQPASGFSESFVMSLVDQFATMQQQMFNQSQQAMMAMAKMLSARQESAAELVSRELSHIRELTQELRDLGRELAASRSGPVRRIPHAPAQTIETAPTQTVETPQAGEADRVTVAEAVSVTSEIVDNTDVDNTIEDELIAETSDSPAQTNQSNTLQSKTETDGQSIEATDPPELAAEPIEMQAEPSELAIGPPELETEPIEAAAEPIELAIESPELEAKPLELAADDAPREDQPPVEGDAPEEDPHAWLSERMAAIDKERNSRWQKITRLLTGATSDEFQV